MSEFFRGAMVRRPPPPSAATKAQDSTSNDLTLGDCIFCIVDLRYAHYKEITKEQLLEYISKAWDGYEKAVAVLKSQH